MRALGVLFMGMLLTLVGAGCGNDCESACSKVYYECEMYFEGVAEKECVEVCKDDEDDFKDIIDCVMDEKCEDLNSCFK